MSVSMADELAETRARIAYLESALTQDGDYSARLLDERDATISDLRHQLEVRADENQRLEYELREAQKRARFNAGLADERWQDLSTAEARITELEAERERREDVLIVTDEERAKQKERAEQAEARIAELETERDKQIRYARSAWKQSDAYIARMCLADTRAEQAEARVKELEAETAVRCSKVARLLSERRSECDRADQTEAEAARLRNLVERLEDNCHREIDRACDAEEEAARYRAAIEEHRLNLWGDGSVGHEEDRNLYEVLTAEREPSDDISQWETNGGATPPDGANGGSIEQESRGRCDTYGGSPPCPDADQSCEQNCD